MQKLDALFKKKYANMMVLREHPNPRCESTPVSPVLGKLVRFLINKCILIIIRLSKLKSSQYPVQMTQKPRKGDFGELKSKNFLKGQHAPDPPRSLRLWCSFRKSFSIDPRSAPESYVTTNPTHTSSNLRGIFIPLLELTPKKSWLSSKPLIF